MFRWCLICLPCSPTLQLRSWSIPRCWEVTDRMVSEWEQLVCFQQHNTFLTRLTGIWELNFFFVTDVDFLAFTASRAFELAYSVIVLLCSRCVSHFYSVFYLQSFISFFEQLSQFFYRGKHLQACAPQKKVGLLLRPDTSSTIKANCCPQIFA